MVNKENMGYCTMRSLFRLEVETTTAKLYEQLTSLKTQPQSAQIIESMLRSVNAIKGAARLVEFDPAIELAHTMEESLTATLKQNVTLSAKQVDVLVNGVNWLVNLSQAEEENFDSWFSQQQQRLANVQQSLASLLTPGVRATPPVAPVLLPTQEPPQQHQAVDATISEPKPETNNNLTNLETLSSSDYIIQNPISQQPVSSPAENPPSTGSDEGVSISGTSMLDLFRLEVEAQTAILNEGLLALESQPQSGKALEALMRAAHSIKGAARIVALDAAVNLAHVMEDCFVAAQNQTITLGADEVDILLHGVDLLINISQVEDGGMNRWLSENGEDIATTRQNIAAILTPGATPVAKEQKKTQQNIPASSSSLATSPTQLPVANNTPATPVKTEPTKLEPVAQKAAPPETSADRVVRVSAENLNRIMGLAGESLIEANWLQPFADSLLILKKRQLELSKMLEELQNTLPASYINQKGDNYLEVVKAKERECREILLERINELELYARRTGNLSDRLYREVIASNMRPFADGVQGFPRMIRDLARKLGKQVKFEIIGKSTPVDRDILKKLEAPLTHILRNSVDHGLETPDIRSAAGKPTEGTVKLEAVHRGGMLSITITDDGKGINFDWLRQKIISKSLSTADLVAQMSESELLEFIFLPGFSTAKQVTEISGRGVGLDVAKSMAQEVGGTVRATTTMGKGTSFHFQLPLTLSVVRTLLVEISGEPYAFPLARIDQIVMVNKADIYSAENRQYFIMNNKNIGLLAANQVLELPKSPPNSDTLPVVVISEQSDYYGLVVDRFLGEHDLVVRPLDPRLGKVQDISAAALMGDGTPILIVDVSDLMRSVDNLLDSSSLNRLSSQIITNLVEQSKRILVVDDSITVREMERKLLENKGYKVDVAVNGMEGWHAVCSNHYDLIVSDVDMPRMNGIEFVSRVKNHPKYNSLPVIIVSYKDREEDRIRGLEVGADYYLTKTSFHDNTLINAVIDLIGN
ncbi:MAG: response regulator [Nostocaceae cyanobacterium]|nr:response regulator [Nostocaceae cyanobacterium]